MEKKALELKEKKAYVAPEMSVIEYACQTGLLEASSGSLDEEEDD